MKETMSALRQSKKFMSTPSKKLNSSPPFRAFLADIATLGVTQVGRAGVRYSVIKARSNPRWWLLPQDERRAAAAGLEMLQPITRAAKVAKA